MAERTQTFLDRNYNVQQLLEKQDLLNEFTEPGWHGTLTVDHFITQIIDEASELLGSGVDYKWWKFIDPATFDHWNAKIETIDIVHFYLSMMILWDEAEGSRSIEDGSCSGSVSDVFGKVSYDQFRTIYIGADEGPTYHDGAMIKGENQLDYRVFANRITSLFLNLGDIFPHIRVLDGLISSVGLKSEEFSAIYAAKAKLNEIRQTQGYKDGTYVKVDDGVEDNARLKTLVDDFLADPTMTLDQLRDNVFNAFYDDTSV